MPETWCGLPDVHLAGVKIDQSWLPRGVMDARICMLLVHPEPGFDTAWWLPRDFWWREDVEAVLQPGR